MNWPKMPAKEGWGSIRDRNYFIVDLVRARMLDLFRSQNVEIH